MNWLTETEQNGFGIASDILSETDSQALLKALSHRDCRGVEREFGM